MSGTKLCKHGRQFCAECHIGPCCEYFKEGEKIINGFIQLVSIRSGHDEYRERGGKQFEYCPWCGAKLHHAKLNNRPVAGID